jgi:4-amino-4-deoxy-L-arabinose transferase-like glycosyltransferase
MPVADALPSQELPSVRQRWLTRLLIFAVALAPRAWLLSYRVARFPSWQWGHTDAADYLNVARYFSISHRLLAARPPLHPLVVKLVFDLGGTDVHAAIVQIVFGALTAVLAYDLARRLLSNQKAALVVGLIVALDVAGIAYTAGLNAEALANLCFTASLLTLVVYLQERRWGAILLSAIWLSLSSLARPTTIYFWVPAVVIIYPLSRQSTDESARRWWQHYAAYAAICLSVVLAWSARNYAYRGVFSFSADGYFSMLFYRAVAVEHRATGLSPQEVTRNYVVEIETALGNPDTDDLTSVDKTRYFPPKDAASYAVVRRLALEAFVEHPYLSLLVTFIGLGRMYIYTETLPASIHPFEVAYHLLLYTLAAWGTWRAYRTRDWFLLLVTGLPILYITGITVFAATAGVDTRMRTPLTPLIAILAVHGLISMLTARRRSRASRAENP